MPEQSLLTRVSITLAGGASGTVAHGIEWPGQGAVAPDLVTPVTAASPIRVDSVAATNLTCTNTSAAPATAQFVCERFHTGSGRETAFPAGNVALGNGLGAAPVDAPYLLDGAYPGLFAGVNVRALAADLNFSRASDGLRFISLSTTLGSVGLGDNAQAASQLFIGFPTLPVVPNANGFYVDIRPALTEAAAGAHTILAGVQIRALNITNGGATTAWSASLYVQGPPTGGTNPYSFWTGAGSWRADLGANQKVYVDATTTSHTDTTGALDIDMRTGTAGATGVDVSLVATDDVANRTTILARAVQAGVGALGNRIAVFSALAVGAAGDTNQGYVAYGAMDFVDAGGAGVGAAFDVGNNWDYALRALSGSIEFLDTAGLIRTTRTVPGAGQDMEIAAAGAVGAGPFNGGDVVLYGGAQIGGGTDGCVKVRTGAGAPGSLIAAQNNLYVEGSLEVDSAAVFDGNLRNTSARRLYWAVVDATPFDATGGTYHYLAVVTAVAARTINLPTAASVGAGYILLVKDRSGNAAVRNITLQPNGTDQIDNGGAGVATVINVNYAALVLVSDGVSNWEIN